MRSHVIGGTIYYGHRRVYTVRSHITQGMICYGHQRVYVVRSHITESTISYGHQDHTSQGVRFVSGIGVCMM